MNRDIVISIKTILIFVLMVSTGWILFQILPVLLALFISLLLTLTLTPLIDWAQERNIPRGVSTALVYVVLLSIFASVGAAGITPVLSQMTKLVEFIPGYIDNSLGLENSPASLSLQEAVRGQLNRTSDGVINATVDLFSNVLFLISILVFTFYLLVEFDTVKQLFINLFPEKKKESAENIVDSVEKILGSYIRGQLILAVIVGVVTYIGLRILGVNFALSLAIVAGVFEILPVIGPILAAIPALIVAIPGGLVSVVSVAIFYTLIQQLENNLLVPKVMERTVGLNPLITLLILLIGGTLFGILGVILAIPTALVVYFIAVEFLNDIFDL